jgi:hypothetical protein
MTALLSYTCAFDMSGSPTITLPGGFTAQNMPIAFQLIGAHLSEALLCRAGHAFQGVTEFHKRHPAQERRAADQPSKVPLEASKYHHRTLCRPRRLIPRAASRRT